MALLIWILPVLVLLGGAGLAAISISFALRFQRRGGEVANMRVTSIDKLKPGPAKIKARVCAREDLLTSPMGHHPCVYFRFIVREARGGGRQRRVETVIDDAQAIDVVLDDGTGTAEIDLGRAEVVLQATQRQSSGAFKDPPQELRDLMSRRYGKSTNFLFFNRALTYIESFLTDQTRIVVVGEVERRPDGALEFRGGNVPLIVGDRDDNQLRTPYRRKAFWCWISAGVLVFLTLSLTFAAVVVAGFVTLAARGVQRTGGGEPASFDQVLADLRSSDGFKRMSALDRLQKMPVDERRRADVQRALEPLLQGNDEMAADGAVRALRTWGDAQSVPALLPLLKGPGRIPQETLQTLATIRDRRAADAVAGALDNIHYRDLAAGELRNIGPFAEPSVLRQLQADDVNTRIAACNVLGDIGTAASLPPLDQLANGGDGRVSGAALLAARAIRGRNPRP
jgi:hypothetical protein